MRARQFGLGDAAVVGLEDLEPESFRSPIARPHALESVAEVATTAGAVILRCFEIQGDQLIPLTCVLQGSLVGRLDPDLRMLAVQAAGPLPGFGIDRNRIIAINAFDLQLWKA